MAGNATIGSLKVDLGLNSASFEAGLKKAQGSLSGFAKSAAALGAIAGVALVAVGTAVGVAIKGAIDRIDELNKVSQQIGVPVEALSKLSYAAGLADVSLEQLAGGLKKFSVNIDAAAAGGGAGAKAFERLGIGVTAANGQLKPTADLMAEVAGKFAGLKDGAGKTALAVQLFGKSGADLIPLLNAGAEGLQAMTAEAESLGLVIDQKTASAADNFNDNLDRLKATADGITTRLAVGVLPALESISAALVVAAHDTAGMQAVAATLSGTLKVLASAAIVVGVAIANTSRVVGAFAKAIVQIFQGDFAGAVDTLKTGFAAGFKGLADGFQNIRALWGSTAGEIRKIAPEVSDGIAAPLAQAADKAKAAAKKIDKAAQDAARAQEEAAKVVSGLRHDLDTLNLTPDEQKDLETRYRIALLIADGFAKEADEARALLIELQQLRQFELADKPDAGDPSGFTPFTDPKLQQASDTYFDRLLDRMDEVEKASYEVGDAIDQIYYGFKNRDWVSAFSGLLKTLDKVKKAFSSTGTTGDKVGAAAAIGQTAGAAIGGGFGAALGGAASGLALGFEVGGPIGAAVGAVAGGLLGLFGHSKAKKAAKKKAAAEARQKEAERVARVAAANRELEIQLIELGGDKIKAEAERRKDFLATLDPTTAALQEQVFAAQDLADAQALLADFQHELAAATDAAATAEADRLKIVEQLPEALRPVANAVAAVLKAQADLADIQAVNAEKIAAAEDMVAEAGDNLEESFDRQAEVLEDAADRFGKIAEDLADVRKELAGQDVTKPGANVGAARARVAQLTAAGDEASLAALPDAIRAFVDAAGESAGSGADFNRNLAFAKQAAIVGEGAAKTQLTAYQAQLEQLKVERDSYNALLGVKTAVFSVADAVAALNAALATQTQAQADALAAVAAGQARIAELVAAATTANDNARLSLIPTPAPTATDVATALVDNAAFAQLIVNTGVTARILDDVTQGGTSLSTIAAA